MHGRVAVLRIGQLCGDTERGVWNKSEAWPLMLGSVGVTGALPRLRGEGVGWLAVDVAAGAVLEVVKGARETAEKEAKAGGDEDEVPVFHILNPDTTRTWDDDLLVWMQRLVPNLKTIPAREWVETLENLEGEAATHPARKLLGLWRNAYCSDDGTQDEDGDDGKSEEKRDRVKGPIFSTEKAKAVAPTMRGVEPVSEEQFRKMWAWIEVNVGVE